jgi:hypothetical protein
MIEPLDEGAELELVLGAAGFRDDCQTAKTRRDLNGLCS